MRDLRTYHFVFDTVVRTHVTVFDSSKQIAGNTSDQAHLTDFREVFTRYKCRAQYHEVNYVYIGSRQPKARNISRHGFMSGKAKI